MIKKIKFYNEEYGKDRNGMMNLSTSQWHVKLYMSSTRQDAIRYQNARQCVRIVIYRRRYKSQCMVSARRNSSSECLNLGTLKLLLQPWIPTNVGLFLSLIPIVYGILTSNITSAEAFGLSVSQQKAYDAFVQQGIPFSATDTGIRSTDSSSISSKIDTDGEQDEERNRIKTALYAFRKAEENQREGQYEDALKGYQLVIDEYSDLALSERARIKKALMEYQVGKVRECILHLEDEEVALRGDAEVHAALAAVLYSERPSQLSLAEEQWDVATEFDSRYSSIDFVEKNRYWPPAMVSALKKFLQLQSS